ncbi:MAG: polyprenyl synthetase family protein [Acetobacteraceae bacterium]|nr:polyprenyl synthetase family protein [Acetobacteraceae bacterium]
MVRVSDGPSTWESRSGPHATVIDATAAAQRELDVAERDLLLGAKPPDGGDGDALAALTALLQADLQACNRTIVAHMDSPVALIPQLAAHIVAAGGKRLRPLLTLASARLCGYGARAEDQRHVNLAACVEFIHTATLLHDDVVDESRLRRGLASANAVFGNKASVLVGDFLFARAFQLMVADGSLPVLAILSGAAATIAEGEVLQLATQNDLSTSEERYLNVIKGKTAALFAAACQVGAVVANRPAAEEQALASYGLNLGMAFQLVDDALDYAADQATLGKTVGDDFREGKITMPVLAAYGASDAEGRRFWDRTIERSEQTEDDLGHALALIGHTGAITATINRAGAFAHAAKQALGPFRESTIKHALLDVADYTLSRAR